MSGHVLEKEEQLSIKPSAAVRQLLCFRQLGTLEVAVYYLIYLDNCLLSEA